MSSSQDRSRSISIPQRCDYFLRDELRRLQEQLISIPQRCDYFGGYRGGRGGGRRHFNTTKVRLFPFEKGSARASLYHFNTTKVRLFLGGREGLTDRALHFNTTKVRLFLGGREGLTDRALHFNTTKVRLFPFPRARRLRGTEYFNTTKVRLFPRASGGRRALCRQFQYHKGAIISPARPRAPPPVRRISIPQRCDYFSLEAVDHALDVRFQYHKGAIISQRLKEQNQLFLGNFKRFSGTCQDHNVVDLQFTLKPRLIDDLI